MTLKSRLTDPRPAQRCEAIRELAEAYFSECTLEGIDAERVFLRTIEDPDPMVQREALTALAHDFHWWPDSPIGPVREQLLRDIFVILSGQTKSRRLERTSLELVGQIVGRLAFVEDFELFPEQVRSNRDFQHGMLDGLSERDLDLDAEFFLRILLDSGDDDICQGAEELLSP